MLDHHCPTRLAALKLITCAATNFITDKQLSIAHNSFVTIVINLNYFSIIIVQYWVLDCLDTTEANDTLPHKLRENLPTIPSYPQANILGDTSSRTLTYRNLRPRKTWGPASPINLIILTYINFERSLTLNSIQTRKILPTYINSELSITQTKNIDSLYPTLR